jgi:hypothetical protein
MEEQKEFILTDERAFYLIKHFEKMDEKGMLHFQQLGHSREAINHALSSIGSKFYARFTENPYELIQQLSHLTPFEIISQTNGNRAFRYKMPFEGGIGTNTLVNIHAIQQTDKSTLKKVIRNGFQVNTIERSFFDPTNELVVVCNPLNEVITVFPGMYAPAFPTQLVDKNEVDAARLFWDNHAFIIHS